MYKNQKLNKKNAAIVFKYEIVDLTNALFDEFDIYVNLI